MGNDMDDDSSTATSDLFDLSRGDKAEMISKILSSMEKFEGKGKQSAEILAEK